MAGLKAGWKGFLASVKIVLTVAGWLLPWAIAIGVPLWFLLWLRRRRRRARMQPADPAGAPARPGIAAAPTIPPGSGTRRAYRRPTTRRRLDAAPSVSG